MCALACGQKLLEAGSVVMRRRPPGFVSEQPSGHAYGRRPASSPGSSGRTARRIPGAARFCVSPHRDPVLGGPGPPLPPFGTTCPPAGTKREHCTLDWRTSLARNLLFDTGVARPIRMCRLTWTKMPVPSNWFMDRSEKYRAADGQLQLLQRFRVRLP